MHFEESSPSFSPEIIPSRDWSGPVTPLALGQGGDGVGCEEATRRDRPFCRALTRQRDGVETCHVRARLELVGRYIDARYRQPAGGVCGVVVAQALEC